jgi:MYXO-CTERM domain-containing protein
LGAASTAANGRYPSAQQLVEQPDDPNRLWLRATFGLLTSTDRGRTWNWVCEEAVGYRGTTDPAIAVTAGGNLLAGVFDGLSVTQNAGCDWDFAPGIGDRFVKDVSVEKDAPLRALIVASRPTDSTATAYEFEVLRTVDAGGSWTQVGADLDDRYIPQTIDAAPSDPSRVYVTATKAVLEGGERDAVLFRSSDGGEAWEEIALAQVTPTEIPLIAAIHPADPDTLYVRVQGDVRPSGFVESYLLVSSNAGTTFEEKIRENADMLGFALSSDGNTVLVGFGDSRAEGNQRPIDADAAGLFRATASALEFEKIQEGHVGCLTWTANDLFVCRAQSLEDFELGISDDAGDTITPVAQLGDVHGLVECPAGSQAEIACSDKWEPICGRLPGCGMPAAGTGGVPPVADAGDPGPMLEPGGGSSSCGCRIAGGRTPWSVAFAASAVFGLLATRRRR